MTRRGEGWAGMLGSPGVRADGAVGLRAERGTVVSYDAVAETAVIQLVGSLTAAVADVPVAKHVDGADMTGGASVIVVFFDPTNVADGVVVGVY